jgi:hydrogenase-4 component E
MSANTLDLLTKILFVFILGTAVLTIVRRTFTSLFTVYSVQSWLIAAVAVILFAREHSIVLLFIALLTVAIKGFLIPYVLRRIQKTMKIERDTVYRYLTPVTSIMVSAAIIFLVYASFSKYLVELSSDNLFLFGAVIGVSLTLIGMLVIFTRQRMITKILGYLTMENGVLLFSLFVSELPFIIEVLIILDLVMLILLSTVLAFGIDNTVEEFHEKLKSFTTWFKE